MKKSLALILAACFLAACTKQAETSSATGNTEFVVDKLFTHEGCTAYRFNDAGTYRYYVNCRQGQTQTSWTGNCGKNCRREHAIEVSTP